MSTDLSGQAENAPTPPEERDDRSASNASASQPAPARAKPPVARQDLGGDQNMTSTGDLSASPGESEQPPDAQGPGDYRNNAAARENREVTAVPGGVAPAEASQQMEAEARPQPAGSSPEQAGGGAGQSFIGDASGYARRWESVQVGFVDDPQAAVQEADTLVSDVMGEVVATFQQQRQQLEAQWSGGGQASTDDLRAAFQRYRDFFQRLLQI
jgi:hypothetical protein